MTAPVPDPSPAPGEAPTGADGPTAQPPARDGASSAGNGPLQGVRQLIDRLLVANVFVVLAGALWFALAVLLHSQGLEGPLRSFQALWQPLFTPAIGLLMAGALISGALGWWQRRGQR